MCSCWQLQSHANYQHDGQTDRQTDGQTVFKLRIAYLEMGEYITAEFTCIFKSNWLAKLDYDINTDCNKSGYLYLYDVNNAFKGCREML